MKITKDFDMDYFNKLPEAITVEILNRIPGESVLHCKLVCRNWRKIVSKDPSFPQKHLYQINHHSAAEDSCKLGFLALTLDDYYYFEYNDDQNHELRKPIVRVRKISWKPFGGINLVGSCNGLVFLSPGFIWNPLTKEYVELPDIGNHINISDDYDEYMSWSYGFGYVSSTYEYKVVATYVSQSEYVQVYICTVGSGNGWKNLGKFNSEFSPMRGHGKFASGAIYWIGRELEVDKLLTFDLLEEKFCQHPARPPSKPDWKLLDHMIGVLDGFLYIPIYDEGDDRFDIWLLKKKNGNHDKKAGGKHQSFEWSKELRVVETELVVAVMKNGGVLTYSNSEHYLNFYDRKASTPKTLVEFREQILRICPHKNTFVSLKELGEQDTQTVESVEPLKQLQEDAIPKCVRIKW